MIGNYDHPKFLALRGFMSDAKFGQMVYNKLRRLYRPNIPKCAMTVSEYMIAARIFTKRWENTEQVDKALRARGWREWDTVNNLVVRGAVCFSKDLRGKKMPDHVYLFDQWADEAQGIAWIIDNYSPKTHLRNILSGRSWHGLRLYNTPYDYHLFPPPLKETP